MSQLEYYDDGSRWGEYSYVTIEQVVNDYLASREDDDFTFNTPRFKVVQQAKKGLRELYYDVLQEIKAVELDLGSTLQVVLPHDYVQYVRISWVGDNGMIYPMAHNNNLRISEVYLQDNDSNILFDLNGNILKTNEILNSGSGDQIGYRVCSAGSFSPNTNTSDIYGQGSFKIDKHNGVISFSSDVEDKSILLEYVSDGLYLNTVGGDTEDDIKIHKFAEQALSDRIYYYLIHRRRNVPMNEKIRAKKEYYNSRRIAKRRLNQANRQELIQAMKGSSVWIKGGKA